MTSLELGVENDNGGFSWEVIKGMIVGEGGSCLCWFGCDYLIFVSFLGFI